MIGLLFVKARLKLTELPFLVSYSNTVFHVRLTRTTPFSLVLFLCFYKWFFLKLNAWSDLLTTVSRESIFLFPFSKFGGEELSFQGDLMTDSEKLLYTFYFLWLKQDRLAGLPKIEIAIRTKSNKIHNPYLIAFVLNFTNNRNPTINRVSKGKIKKIQTRMYKILIFSG